MILHVYHCTFASFHDYRSAPGRNRPAGTGRYPARPGQADIDFLPPTNSFGDPMLGRLLELFQSVDLVDRKDSPVRINWKNLETQLGVERDELRALMRQAAKRGLLRALTIDYDYQAWMRESGEKGSLVVMTGVEHTDFDRDPGEYTASYCNEIDRVKRAVLNPEVPAQFLRRVAVVPNGHLNASSREGVPSGPAYALLESLIPPLRRRGYLAELNSYGYTKIIRLGINAHKVGYTLRVA